VPWIHCAEDRPIFFIIQNFEQLPLAVKNRICPKNFHCIEIFFIFQDFWATCACPEKQSVSWIHCSEYIFFIIQNFEQLAFSLKFFPVLKYFLSFRIFEQVVLALKTELALNFSSRGVGSPPRPSASYATEPASCAVWVSYRLINCHCNK